MAMDLCIIDYQRLRDRSAYSSAKVMVSQQTNIPFYGDLISHCGKRAIEKFEMQSNGRMEKILSKIKFRFQ